MRARNHTNPFTIRHRFDPLNVSETFPKHTGTLCYEIGFGRGVFLRQYAENHPDHSIVGVEVRKSIVQVLEDRLAANPLPNCHILHGNGEIALEDLFEDNSLDKVFIFHPDPWFKKKHAKRRVVNPKFLTTLETKLKSEGKLYVSTDVDILWEAMLESINENGQYEAINEPSFWEKDYQTHWQVFSDKDQRSRNFGVFQLHQKAI